MSEQFAWISDASAGECLRSLDHAPSGTIFDIIPAGFAAYARIFHPAERSRPAAEKSWAGLDMFDYHYNAMVTGNVIEHELCSWATVAQAFGTHMHPQAQYPQLVCQNPHHGAPKVAADGWAYTEPRGGSLPLETLSTLAHVLAQHTTTAGSGVAAIWEGYGGLTSSAGTAYLSFDASHPVAEPSSGILPVEIATGARLSLDDGAWNYFLFNAGISSFGDDSWLTRAPWIDPPFDQTPTYLWPDDHAWMLHTNVDLDTSIIGGSQALIDHLVRAPGVEALPLPVTADLSRDGGFTD